MSNVVFFDFDSTVISKESLDEVLAHALSQHPEKERLMQEIETITNRGMNGEIPFTESARLRLATVPITRAQVQHVGELLTHYITEGMPELFSWLSAHNSTPYIISGGFNDAIMPTARILGVPVEHVYTNHFIYNDAGNIVGADTVSLLWTNEGKAPVIRHVLSHYNSPTSALLGDGSNDLAAYTHGAVQHFCGFGAHAIRPKVRAEAPAFVYTAHDAQQWLAKVLEL